MHKQQIYINKEEGIKPAKIVNGQPFCENFIKVNLKIQLLGGRKNMKHRVSASTLLLEMKAVQLEVTFSISS